VLVAFAWRQTKCESTIPLIKCQFSTLASLIPLPLLPVPLPFPPPFFFVSFVLCPVRFVPPQYFFPGVSPDVTSQNSTTAITPALNEQGGGKGAEFGGNNKIDFCSSGEFDLGTSNDIGIIDRWFLIQHSHAQVNFGCVSSTDLSPVNHEAQVSTHDPCFGQ